MQSYKFAGLTLVVCTLAAPPAWAQEEQSPQVTPFVAVGTGDAAPVGVAVTFPFTSMLSVEGDVGYRNNASHIRGLSTNASLLFSLPSVGKATPYLATGFGVSNYAAPVFSSLNAPPIGAVSRLGLNANFGGGLRTRLTNRVDLRTDARWFMPVANGARDPYQTGHFRLGIGAGVSLGSR
jgi:hypothetical protein